MLKPGETVDRYVVERLLGQGGMATVYLIRHRRLGSLHALKVLHLTHPAVRERLLREGRVQAQLRHPNLVAVTDVLTIGEQSGLVLEYVDGPGLDRWLKDNEPTVAEALWVFRGIVLGVGAAHAHGVVHRDLKPANILLQPTNAGVVPKIADFGLMKSVHTPDGLSTRSGVAIGTPNYMAPEQVLDATNVDARADMFALGCILYELICDVRAFDAPEQVTVFNQILKAEYTPPEEIIPDIPPRVRQVLSLLMEVDPSKRLSNCDMVFDMLYEEHGVGRLRNPKAMGHTGAGDVMLDEPTLPNLGGSGSGMALVAELDTTETSLPGPDTLASGRGPRSTSSGRHARVPKGPDRTLAVVLIGGVIGVLVAGAMIAAAVAMGIVVSGVV